MEKKSYKNILFSKPYFSKKKFNRNMPTLPYPYGMSLVSVFFRVFLNATQTYINSNLFLLQKI